jgi:hypothetical protein
MAMSWSTDKIIAVGLLLAFVGSIVMGGDRDLQTFIAGGLLGYLRSSEVGGKKDVKAMDETKDVAKKQP